MANFIQSLKSSLESLQRAESLVTEQLRNAIIAAINETAKELDDKKSAAELLNYLTDTFHSEPVSNWVCIIKYAANKKPGLGATEETVELVHSYFMSGCSKFIINCNFLTTLLAKITED